MAAIPIPTEIITAEEILPNDIFREIGEKKWLKVVSIHDLPNSQNQAPVGAKLMVIIDGLNPLRLLKETEVEIIVKPEEIHETRR